MALIKPIFASLLVCLGVLGSIEGRSAIGATEGPNISAASSKKFATGPKWVGLERSRDDV